ncbi:glycosyl transferase, group 1, partial [Streptomyces clavuligerus]|uniref:glycosyl transferase, group 1 n=5 Tax=Streptomyces clavuligerus TaxID=1901 RepID=UPI0018D068A3
PFTHPGIRITTAPARKVVDTCEVVLTTDLPDTTLLLHAHRTGVRIVAENAPPVEHLHYTTLTGDDGAELYRDTVARWRLQLLLADHLLVRSEAEHASVLGALVTAGRMSVAHHQTDPGLAHLVSLVPLGFTRHAAATAATADAAAVVTEGACDLLWNGGVWDYCHPAPVLTALARLGPGAPVLRLMYA